ncbi:MAG: protocatechuate 3,4-dioxygenase [Rubrivivax sp.]|nr:protocatechuate 3,4-dioxygenase [Rubrivivax sp.]
MAQIIGSLCSSHVPAIGRAIAQQLQQEPYWKPFFDGWGPAQRWLAQARPDVLVVFYNDHGLNFFLDKMPTFAIGATPEYSNADEGWGLPQVPAFRGEVDLSWHLVNALVGEDFDLTTCQEMRVDHAITNPMQLMFPGPAWPVRIVPICINTVQFPLPSARRCWALGDAVGRAVRAWDSDARVLVVGSGGLSHQLDGERAGFIHRDFDLAFLESLVHNPRWATQFDTHQLVEQAGTQGVELLMWLAARAALGDGATRVHQSYHIPISNTAAGLLVMAPAG